MPAILLGILYTALRWALVAGVMVIFWNYHQEVAEWGYAKVMGFLDSAGVPTLSLPDFETWLTQHNLTAFVAMANEWLPLSEFLGAVVTYCTFFITITPLKLILRRIPFING